MRLFTMFPGINKKVALDSVFNVGRNLINPLFIAVISYIFLKRGFQQDLLNINKTTALYNLILVFSGWGIKDYLFKDSTRPYHEFNRNWHLAFYSKIILLLPLIIISVFSFPHGYLAFILTMAVFKTFSTMYESLVIFYKKSRMFFMIEFLTAGSAILLAYYNILNDYSTFFCFLLFIELFKAGFNITIFKKPSVIYPNIRDLLVFLKETKFYFLIVIVSFFQSRIDLYLLGFLFSPEKLNEYQLILSLISLAQIVIVSFVVSYSKLFYRNINLSMLTFRKIVFRSGFFVAVISAFLIYGILNFIYDFNFKLINVMVILINITAFAWVLYEMYYYTKLEWFNKMLRLVFISGALNFLFGIVLIPVSGITGALAGNSIALVTLSVLMSTQRFILLKRETF